MTESTNAECAMEGERIRSARTDASKSFEFCSRNVCYDGASTFPRRERAFEPENPELNIFMAVCENHNIAKDQKDTFLRIPRVCSVIEGTVTFTKVVNVGMKFL